MFNSLIVFFKKIRLLCLACDIFVYHFHLFAEVISAIFLSPFTVSEKSAAAVRNAYGVILQIIAVGNKGREIA